MEELLPEGVRYVLPVRPGGRLGGGILMLIGAGCIGHIVYLVAASLAKGPFDLFDLMPGFPSLIGTSAFFIGLYSAAAWNEVVIQGGVLKSIEHFGPIARRKQIEQAEAKAFVVDRYPRSRQYVHGPEGDFWAVWAGEVAFAAGYPREWCNALAQEFSRRCLSIAIAAEGPKWLPVHFAVAPIAQPVLSPDGTVRPQNVALPADSPIKKQDRPEGMTIEIPAAGLFRGSKGLFVGTLMAIGFMGVLTAIMITVAGNWPQPVGIFPFVIIGILWLVVAAMLVAAINLGLRRASITVAGGRLLVIQTGLFGEKKKEWDADEIKDVCAGPSGMKVNNVDVLELQVHTLDGKKQGFLSGRRDEELYWLAATISERLKKGNSP